MPGGQGGPVGDQQGGLVVAQAGDGDLADRAGVGRQQGGGSSWTLTRRVVPLAGRGSWTSSRLGQGGQGLGDAGGGRAR